MAVLSNFLIKSHFLTLLTMYMPVATSCQWCIENVLGNFDLRLGCSERLTIRSLVWKVNGKLAPKGTDIAVASLAKLWVGYVDIVVNVSIVNIVSIVVNVVNVSIVNIVSNQKPCLLSHSRSHLKTKQATNMWQKSVKQGLVAFEKGCSS